jgi:hypothetical protein
LGASEPGKRRGWEKKGLMSKSSENERLREKTPKCSKKRP